MVQRAEAGNMIFGIFPRNPVVLDADKISNDMKNAVSIAHATEPNDY